MNDDDNDVEDLAEFVDLPEVEIDVDEELERQLDEVSRGLRAGTIGIRQ